MDKIIVRLQQALRPGLQEVPNLAGNTGGTSQAVVSVK